MIRRFVDDDPGYVAWLAAHPLGFVLNTFPHVTASYLVLHRAKCRTVNRPLSDDRCWTHSGATRVPSARCPTTLGSRPRNRIRSE